MNSRVLDDIYKFHFQSNNKSKILLKQKNIKTKKIFISCITYGLITFLLLFYLLNKFTNLNLSYKFLICEFFSLGIFLSSISIYISKINKYTKNFCSFINTHSEIKIGDFSDFTKFNLLKYIYETKKYNVENINFKDLYDLIDISLDRYNINDYISPKSILIYGGIMSLLVALLNNIFSYNIVFTVAILVILLTLLYFYFIFSPIFESKLSKTRKNYTELKFILKKCEIEHKYLKEELKNSYKDELSKLVNSAKNFK